jgi:1-phosphofructokinase family hexose kinase
MILTLTPNTALDRVIFVDDFAFGETIRASMVVDGMGGKGTITSWVLGQLGTSSLATGFVGGETGRRLEEMLRRVGAQPNFLHVAGETRTTYVVVRNADHAHASITSAGLCPGPEDASRLIEHVSHLLWRADFLHCAGTLPPGLPVNWYVGVIREARARGVSVLLDTSDPFLAATLRNAGPDGLPDVIKPNATEASALLGRPIPDRLQAIQAARELRAWGIGAVIITLGADGAVAATGEGLWMIPPVPVPVVNAAGAGDGFNAGLMQARVRGESWPLALRWAAAVATAVVLTPAPGECRLEDVRALYPRVCVERLN